MHDNESKLAPTLERLNSVTAVLEKNRDNIAKALPGLAKFEITLGEAISSMYAYSAFVPNFLVPQLFQAVPRLPLGIPHLRHGSRSRLPVAGTSGADPLAVQRYSSVPWLYVGRQDRRIAMIPRRQAGDRGGGRPGGLVVAGAAVLVRNTFFGPRTITAYFPTATAIYPGDEVRVSGVKVGNDQIHSSRGHAGQDDPQGRP